jgi:hypothetical protein
MKVWLTGRNCRTIQAGSPLSCFLPSCRKPCIGRCVHANDGHFYCSEGCAEEGARMDMAHIEQLAKRR